MDLRIDVDLTDGTANVNRRTSSQGQVESAQSATGLFQPQIPSTSSDPPLFRVPQEIFQKFIEYLDEPADFFHFGTTCKAMGPQLEYMVRLDARRYREMYLENVWFGAVRLLFKAALHPFHTMIVAWAIETRQPPTILGRFMEIYAEEFPECVEYENGSPLEMFCMRYDNPSALAVLIEKGLSPPVSVAAGRYVINASERQAVHVTVWLALQGVDLAPYLDRLGGRNMLAADSHLREYLETYTHILDNWDPPPARFTHRQRPHFRPLPAFIRRIIAARRAQTAANPNASSSDSS